MADQDVEVELPSEQKLPKIRETASINQVFHQLARQNVGTFFLLSEGRPPRSIQGVALANALLDLDPNSRSGDLKIGDVIEQYRRKIEAAVQARMGSTPPVFICSNKPPHENLEWNDGYCSECPFPLESSR